MLIPTGYERALPPGVQVTVRARRAALAQRATGRVLDLGGADSHRHLWKGAIDAEVLAPPRPDGTTGDAALDRLVDNGERFDTIFSAFHCIATPSLAHTLDRLMRLLTDDGQLLFLEPGPATGMSRHLHRLSAPLLSLTSGWSRRDVPASMRRAGLTITDVERHRSRTMQPWVQWLVEGVARPSLINPR